MLKIPPDGSVVIVDDDRVDRRVALRCVRRSALASCRWLECASGQDLLELLERVRAGALPLPSLVLLDLSMPRMDGFQLLERVRADPFFRDVPPFIVLTTSDRPSDRDRAEALGAAAFVSKPTSMAAFVAFFDALA